MLAGAMASFRRDGVLPADDAAWERTRALFEAERLDDAGTEAIIWDIYRETGEILDPHSAVAVAAMRAAGGEPGIPRVALACAHPAKFPDVIERVTGRRPKLPPHLADLLDRPERINRVPAAFESVRRFIAARARRGGAA
jgi:threonine synthase